MYSSLAGQSINQSFFLKPYSILVDLEMFMLRVQFPDILLSTCSSLGTPATLASGQHAVPEPG